MIRYKATRRGYSQYARDELQVNYNQPGLVRAPGAALSLGYGILVYASMKDALEDNAREIIEVEVAESDRLPLPEKLLTITELSLKNLLKGPVRTGWPPGTEMYSQVWVRDTGIPVSRRWNGREDE